MGRKSQKSKDKIQARRAEEKAAREQIAASKALVDAANKAADPMEQLAPFKKFDRNGLSITLSCQRVTDLDKTMTDWVFDITKRNMEVLYEASGWGWNDKDKKAEMTEDAAWYLIARDAEGKAVAMSHFRFDLDEEDEVLYCYEIQLEKPVRRKGLGKFMMQILELMAHKWSMRKVMLTVFNENDAARKFFKDKLKYKMDETSPQQSFVETMFDDEAYSYEILSKDMAPRKPLSKVQPQQQHASHVHHVSSSH